MSQFSQSRQLRRAPRANLRTPVSATVHLENGRQIFAKLHRLSITGGLLELGACVEERVWVNLTIFLNSGPVRPTAEMMFPMRGGDSYLQPFRITRLRAEELHLLDREVTELRKLSFAPNASGHGIGFRPPNYYLEST
jgi:hypothetical protein